MRVVNTDNAAKDEFYLDRCVVAIARREDDRRAIELVSDCQPPAANFPPDETAIGSSGWVYN